VLTGTANQVVNPISEKTFIITLYGQFKVFEGFRRFLFSKSKTSRGRIRLRIEKNEVRHVNLDTFDSFLAKTL
jgi:hypothetical protein